MANILTWALCFNPIHCGTVLLLPADDAIHMRTPSFRPSSITRVMAGGFMTKHSAFNRSPGVPHIRPVWMRAFMHASLCVCPCRSSVCHSPAALGIDPLPVYGVLMTPHPRSKRYIRWACRHHSWAPPPTPDPSAFHGTRVPAVFLSPVAFAMSAPPVV